MEKTNKSGLRFIGGVCGCMAFALLFPALAWGWGSTVRSPLGAYATHQFIDLTAYECLRKDPAFAPRMMPTLGAMRQWEDMEVDISFAGMVITGRGPDVDGNTAYSDHWYNPNLGQGRGPEAVSNRAFQSANALGKDAQGADWAAHFMADMSVPVHINGVMRERARTIYNSVPRPQPVYLDTSITGPLVAPLLGGRTNQIDWRLPMETFLARTNAFMDYFDPWYWLGESHAVWEAGTPKHTTDFSKNPSYNSKWKNGAPSFDGYAGAYAGQARLLAMEAASDTYNDYAQCITAQGVQKAMDRSIQNVYTLWRGGFSALQPEVLIECASDGGGGQKIKAGGRIINMASEEAKNVRVRLTTIIQGKETKLEEKDLKSIPGGRQEALVSEPWEVDVPAADPSSKEKPLFRLEVIGQYDTTPDLQYARHEKALQPLEYSIILLMDCSGSMAGEKIENAKKSAKTRISALDEKTEAAILVFTDCGSIYTLAPFAAMTAENKASMQAQVDLLQSSGGTPIAAAVDYADAYMRFAMGKEQTLVLLSDGEETCSGDPVKSAEGLNK